MRSLCDSGAHMSCARTVDLQTNSRMLRWWHRGKTCRSGSPCDGECAQMIFFLISWWKGVRKGADHVHLGPNLDANVRALDVRMLLVVSEAVLVILLVELLRAIHEEVVQLHPVCLGLRPEAQRTIA